MITTVNLGRLGEAVLRVEGCEQRENAGDHAGRRSTGNAVRAGVYGDDLLGVPRQGQDQPRQLLSLPKEGCMSTT